MKKYIKPSIAKIAINPIVLFAKSPGTSDEEVDTSQGGIQLGKKQHYNSWDNIWK